MSGGGEPSLTASAIVAQAVGSHILRIDGYSQTKGLGNGKFIASEDFTVGGHRWCLKYYPDGESSENSDWIFIFLNLASASYYSEVKAEFKISLLDQEGNPVPSYSNSSTTCTFSSTQRSLGYDLIKRSDLEGSVYLKGNVFSVRCDVTVATNKIITKAISVSAVTRGV